MTLADIWFILVVVLLIGYAVLDGFDFGVGILHLLNRGDRQRRIALNAIGPVWDGNEVWLITAGGALFAAFPPVYATVFSGCYTALMLLLAALIGRAVAIEFRSQSQSPAWRGVWDWIFSIGSFLSVLLLSVAFANVLRGFPIDAEGDFAGMFFGLLNPFALLAGLLGVTACATHGAIYLAGKGDDDMRPRLVRTAAVLWVPLAILTILTFVAAWFAAPHLYQGPLLSVPGIVLLLVVVLSIVGVRLLLVRGLLRKAFLASSVAIGSLVALAGLANFPNLVHSTINPDFSLTTANASSTQRTLETMLIIAIIGVPLVLAYSVIIHRFFRGKVVLGEDGHGY